MRERNVAVCIILSIVTCGLYGLYWIVCLGDDVCTISDKNNTSGGMVLVLTLITCGLYGLYWLYTCGEAVDNYKNTRGVHSSYSGIVYLALSLLGVGIISYALLQNELNNISNGRYDVK